MTDMTERVHCNGGHRVALPLCAGTWGSIPDADALFGAMIRIDAVNQAGRRHIGHRLYPKRPYSRLGPVKRGNVAVYVSVCRTTPHRSSSALVSYA